MVSKQTFRGLFEAQTCTRDMEIWSRVILIIPGSCDPVYERYFSIIVFSFLVVKRIVLAMYVVLAPRKFLFYSNFLLCFSDSLPFDGAGVM